MRMVSVKNGLCAAVLATVAVSHMPAARADFASDVQECQRCLDEARIKQTGRALVWGFFGALGAAIGTVATGGTGAAVCIPVAGAGITAATASAVSDEISGDGCAQNAACHGVIEAYEKYDRIRQEHNCPR